MIDKLKSMAIFSEVAHLGSFRSAAKSQGISPSVISRHISLLEESLGEVLLNRSTRKLALTSMGTKFLVHCDDMLEAANLGLSSVQENIDQGDLRITLPITLAIPKFGELIARYRDQNPLVNFSLVFDDNQVDIIETGVDIALRLGPLEDSSLKSKRIATIRRSMVCTPQYLSSVGKMRTLSDLNKCSWIGRKNPSVSSNLNSQNGELYTIPYQPQFVKVNSVEAIKAFVLSHNGVGIFPDIMVEGELRDGSAIRLLPKWQAESMHLSAVWSAQRTTGQLVKKFVDYLAAELDVL